MGYLWIIKIKCRFCCHAPSHTAECCASYHHKWEQVISFTSQDEHLHSCCYTLWSMFPPPFKMIMLPGRQLGGAVVCTFASQQEVSRFKSHGGISVWSLHILLFLRRFPSGSLASFQSPKILLGQGAFSQLLKDPQSSRVCSPTRQIPAFTWDIKPFLDSRYICTLKYKHPGIHTLVTLTFDHGNGTSFPCESSHIAGIDAECSLGVNVRVNACASLYVSPVMSWRLVQASVSHAQLTLLFWFWIYMNIHTRSNIRYMKYRSKTAISEKGHGHWSHCRAKTPCINIHPKR